MTIASRFFERALKLPPPPSRAVQVQRDLRIPMPDGVELLADRYVPGGAERPPLVLVRSPYGRRGVWGLSNATSLPGALLAIPVLLGKLALCGLAIVVIDTSFAKLRFFRIAEFLGAAFMLALVGVATSYVIGA